MFFSDVLKKEIVPLWFPVGLDCCLSNLQTHADLDYLIDYLIFD